MTSTPSPAPEMAVDGADPAASQRQHNEGHGRRLTAAFEALEAFPALEESRNRLLALVSAERISAGDVVNAVESDVALLIAVLRLGNQVGQDPRAGGVRRPGRRPAVARSRPVAGHAGSDLSLIHI